MSGRPWDADRPLTLDGARSAIAAQFPQVNAATLEYLDSGWEFDAYLTPDGWVFRFPRQAWCADLFDKERRIHELVARVLPPGVAVPTTQLIGAPSDAFCYRFAGHRYIPGVSAEDVATENLPRLARDLGAAFRAIHSIPEAAARAAGAILPDPDEEGRREWLARKREGATRLRGLDPAIEPVLDWFESVAFPLPRYEGPLRFVHDDVSPEHLVVDPTTGQLTGIIDWTDAALGDPVSDFIALVTSLGWPFAAEVVGHYRMPLDGGFHERLRFAARLRSVFWLAEAYERERHVAKHIRWVVNAFAA